MSTEKEKLTAIGFAVEAARRRMKQIMDRKEFIGKLSRAEIYEYDMCLDCVQRGEKLLKERDEL